MAIKNYFKHFKTVTKHRWLVFVHCKRCGIPFRGLRHDLSKYLPVEFVPSVHYFQGNRSPISAEKEDKGVSYAWQHHKGHNKHHWEYWTDFDKKGNLITYKMPYDCVVEMVCDWIAASITYNNGWDKEVFFKYYIDHMEQRKLHPETLNLVEWFLIWIDHEELEKGFYETAKDKVLKEGYEKKGGLMGK